MPIARRQQACVRAEGKGGKTAARRQDRAEGVFRQNDVRPEDLKQALVVADRGGQRVRRGHSEIGEDVAERVDLGVLPGCLRAAAARPDIGLDDRHADRGELLEQHRLVERGGAFDALLGEMPGDAEDVQRVRAPGAELPGEERAFCFRIA